MKPVLGVARCRNFFCIFKHILPPNINRSSGHFWDRSLGFLESNFQPSLETKTLPQILFCFWVKINRWLKLCGDWRFIFKDLKTSFHLSRSNRRIQAMEENSVKIMWISISFCLFFVSFPLICNMIG